MKRELIDRYLWKLEHGDIDNLYEEIKDHIKERDAYALYFYSCISLEEWNESMEDFDTRSFNLKLESADKGCVEAMYQLAAEYFYGEHCEVDTFKGQSYLKKAVNLGYGKAYYSYALNLYYGSNGYTQNRKAALLFMRKACEANVECAEDMLKEMQTNKEALVYR